MRRKMACATVLAVCLALVVAPAMSADGSDRGGRGKTTPISEATGNADGSLTQKDDAIRHEIIGIRQAPATQSDKAQMLLGAANGQQGDDAIATLNMVLALQLESTPENDKLLGAVYSRLGELYQGVTQKQVYLYGMALQYTADPAARLELENRIAAAGGDVFDIAFNGASQASSSRTIGVGDTCDTATAVTVPYDSGYTITIDLPDGDDIDWYRFDVAGPGGILVTIQTWSDTGPLDDDTQLQLWQGCVGGSPMTQLAVNSDIGGLDWQSRIISGCLGPGDYYVATLGEFGDAPDNFRLTITQNGTCTPPQPDAYEPDDVREAATAIGLPTSIPLNANGWGRAHKEIQAHSFVPAGEIDWVEFKITRNELVRMGTAIQFPTKWNNFTQINAGIDNDTVEYLFYGTEPYYGGLCNDGIFGTICVTDADCGPPVIPGYPPCIPYYNFSGVPETFYSYALAFNDDIGGGNFGSQLLFCLPPDSIVSPFFDREADSYYVAAFPFSTADLFEYEIRVKNEVRCNFSAEPNSSLSTMQPITLGETWHGIYDFAIFQPDPDEDLFSFDLTETRKVVLATNGYDGFLVDTALQLYVGPDDDGFFYLAAQDDDGGPNWLSLLTINNLPPADVILGNTTADADWIIDVTSFYLNPNFPWTLNTSASAPPISESEPNNTIATADAVSLGTTISGTLSPACDYDVYRLPIGGAANMFVTFDILGSFDTSMELVDCNTDTRIACDDDGGPGLASKIDACLAPGQDYCVKVRPYSTISTGAYGLQIGAGVAGCPNPGTGVGDGLYRCIGNQFDTCP